MCIEECKVVDFGVFFVKSGVYGKLVSVFIFIFFINRFFVVVCAKLMNLTIIFMCSTVKYIQNWSESPFLLLVRYRCGASGIKSRCGGRWEQ